MTAAEMHIIFRILLDRVEADYYRNILAEEIDVFLNDAQLRFIKQRYGGNNVYKTGFEETQKRIDDLRTIVIPNVSLTLSSNQTGAKVGGKFYNLPTNYMFAVQEEAEINYTDCKGNIQTQRLGFIPITLNNYNSIVEDPYMIPNPSNGDTSYGLRLMFDRLEALTFNNFNIDNYYLTYIKQPASITNGANYITPVPNVNCELPVETHIEIVNIGVNIALEVMESRRFQQNSILLQSQE